MATRSDAGKGDRNRSWSKEFFDGYDKIDWSKKPSREEPPAQSAPQEPEEVHEEEEAPIEPYSLEMYFSFCVFIHTALAQIIQAIPHDYDGDIAPIDGDAIMIDLLSLAADVETEAERIYRVVSFTQ